MRKFIIKCPVELNNELQRLSYELSMENTVIDRFLDRHFNDPEALDSPIFMKYAKSVAEKNAEYEMLKDRITTDVLPGIKGHDADWNLDFPTGDITVTVRCNCDIPFLHDEGVVEQF